MSPSFFSLFKFIFINNALREIEKHLMDYRFPVLIGKKICLKNYGTHYLGAPVEDEKIGLCRWEHVSC